MRASGGWLWLDVVDFSAEEALAVSRAFGFDPIAMEDVTDLTEFPKVDDYEDHAFVVAHGVAPDPARLHTSEYNAFIGYRPTWSPSTGRTCPSSAGCATGWRSRGGWAGPAPTRCSPASPRPGRAASSRWWRASRSGCSTRRPVPWPGTTRWSGEVQALRRDALMLRKIVGPLRDTFMRLGSEELAGVGERARLRCQSVRDHYFRIAESLDTAQAVLGAVLETYRSTVAERTNEVMKVLTVFTAVLLPLSLVAGIYGMNFVHMPELGWRLGYLWALGVMVVIGLGAVGVLRPARLRRRAALAPGAPGRRARAWPTWCGSR